MGQITPDVAWPAPLGQAAIPGFLSGKTNRWIR
jgi:hypothetical protein